MQDPVVGPEGADATDVPGTTDSSVGGVPTSGQDAQPDGATDGGKTAAPDGAQTIAGEARAAESAAAASAANGAATEVTADPELERVRAELAERTADLQRVSAEFTNYRRRTERERESTVAGAKAAVAGELLTVLDDVERAQNHGDLTGPFKVVADRLSETLHRAGLEPFGAEGDVFDPSVHEAVAHETSSEVSGPTVTTVMRRGYRFGDRVLRAAMVGVTDSDGSAPAAPSEPADAGTAGTS